MNTFNIRTDNVFNFGIDCIDLIEIAGKERTAGNIPNDSKIYETVMSSMQSVSVVIKTEHATDEEDELAEQKAMAEAKGKIYAVIHASLTAVCVSPSPPSQPASAAMASLEATPRTPPSETPVSDLHEPELVPATVEGFTGLGNTAGLTMAAAEFIPEAVPTMLPVNYISQPPAPILTSVVQLDSNFEDTPVIVGSPAEIIPHAELTEQPINNLSLSAAVAACIPMDLSADAMGMDSEEEEDLRPECASLLEWALTAGKISKKTLCALVERHVTEPLSFEICRVLRKPSHEASDWTTVLMLCVKIISKDTGEHTSSNVGLARPYTVVKSLGSLVTGQVTQRRNHPSRPPPEPPPV